MHCIKCQAPSAFRQQEAHTGAHREGRGWGQSIYPVAPSLWGSLDWWPQIKVLSSWQTLSKQLFSPLGSASCSTHHLRPRVWSLSQVLHSPRSFPTLRADLIVSAIFCCDLDSHSLRNSNLNKSKLNIWFPPFSSTLCFSSNLVHLSKYAAISLVAQAETSGLILDSSSFQVLETVSKSYWFYLRSDHFSPLPLSLPWFKPVISHLGLPNCSPCFTCSPTVDPVSTWKPKWSFKNVPHITPLLNPPVAS